MGEVTDFSHSRLAAPHGKNTQIKKIKKNERIIHIANVPYLNKSFGLTIMLNFEN